MAKVINVPGVNMNPMKTLFSFGMVVLVLLVLVAGCNMIHIVPAGHRGVKFNILQGGVVQHSYGEGIAWKFPFIESFINMDVRVAKDEPQCTAASKDLQTVQTTVALNSHPAADMAHVLYQSVGTEYHDRIVAPAIQESVKAVTAVYTAEELITKREEVKDKIFAALVSKLTSAGIVVTAVNITNFQFSDAFNSAIEDKQTAEQRAQKAKRDLERIKIEAEQRIAQAHAEAEAQRMLAASITPAVVELKRIEAFNEAIRKWNGTMPQVSTSTLPFWDVLKGQGRE